MMRFIFDIDGTIAFDGLTIEESIKDLLLEYVKLGHEIVFASARSYRDCLKILGDQLNKHCLVTLNGGAIYRQGECLQSYPLDVETFQNLLEICHDNELAYFVDDPLNFSTYLSNKIPFIHSVDRTTSSKEISIEEMLHPVKMVIFVGDDSNDGLDAIKSLQQISKVDLAYHEHEGCLYINPLGVNKATSLKEVFGGEYVAFGNDQNDIAMFQSARKAIQIGNFKPLMAFADQIIEPGPGFSQRLKQVLDQSIEELME
ncbi:HAD family phosphatase [Facklamia sp. DSM 111018]|uniref:HAD family phosphatase n=1 Tax=Facklamia lactis TaxID=2749967 RepID=A0ABS0LNP2_9LACT|nr:HAD family hydrolase [Facklamia lactis]MBG9979718.1 HAD family phosphatase [Facklamia lactis]MBG9985602.1 HAD family phosphatase [Facklamia lactis]